MDLKGTLAAISLSAAVIVLWGLFFAPSPDHVKKVQELSLKMKILSARYL